MAVRPERASELVEPDPAYVEAVEAAQADVDAGRTVAYERVRRWLLTWGTDEDLPPPQCG